MAAAAPIPSPRNILAASTGWHLRWPQVIKLFSGSRGSAQRTNQCTTHSTRIKVLWSTALVPVPTFSMSICCSST